LDSREVQEVLRNPQLARLGDAFVNFIFSLALTQSCGEPVGIKVSDKVLFEAAKKSAIRSFLPRRMKRGHVANVVEALIVNSWLKKSLSIEEMTRIVCRNPGNLSDAAAELLKDILERMKDR